MDARVFVPGHITGFFEIHLEGSDALKCGSRGAGFCIGKGAVTAVTVEPSEGLNVKVILNNEELPAGSSATHRVVDLMLGTQPYDVTIETNLEVPVSQGLGMSGAGALGTAIALDSALELKSSSNKLFGIAHRAEVELRSGLGDVIAQSLGGLEVRSAPGAPPFGKIDVTPWEENVLLVVLEPPLVTEEIISSAEHRARLNSLCSKMLGQLGTPPAPGRFLKLARSFTVRSELASEGLLEALEAVPEGFGAGMAMLGNTLYITGEGAHALEPEFRHYGQCIQTEVDNRGCRKL